MSLLACGLSTATNSIPASISVAMNARLRASRSQLGDNELGLVLLTGRERSSELRAIRVLAALDSR